MIAFGQSQKNSLCLHCHQKLQNAWAHIPVFPMGTSVLEMGVLKTEGEQEEEEEAKGEKNVKNVDGMRNEKSLTRNCSM